MASTEPRTVDWFDPETTLRTPEHQADPHPLYHRMREEAPVLHVPEWDEFILTRYVDCEAVLRDARFSSNPKHRRLEIPIEMQDMRTQMSEADTSVLLFLDPPDHTRIRGLVSRAFTPKRVEEMRSRVRSLVDEILDEAEAKGEFDVVLDLGYLVPVTVICQMLGVPERDRHLFHEWSAAATRLLDGVIPQDEMMQALGGAMSIVNYLNEVIEDRRAHPGDDLLTALIQVEEEGEKLSESELRAIVLLLFVAGHETTMNLIGNGTYALLRNRDQLRRLHDEPSLIGSAVEELLRFDGPVHLTGRTATADVEVNGFTVERGMQVVALLAAANRDPERYPHPDRLDLSRTDNHHLTFSHGMHYCLGASLARVEGQEAIGALARRFPDMELISAEVRYRDHFVLRGLEELRVSVA